MSRGAARFTQADVARAIRAADQAKTKKVVDILPDGTIRISDAPDDHGSNRRRPRIKLSRPYVL
jgi:hypothetical protein